MKRDPIGGRAIALASTMTIVSLVVIVPLALVVATSAGMSKTAITQALLSPRALAALRMTFVASFAAAAVDLIAGAFIAWVLVKRRARALVALDAMVDVPLALPTAVTGIALATLYGAHGWIGTVAEAHGIHIAYTPIGVWLALTFVGFPFVVRAIQPVLAKLPADIEEAAVLLGAGRFATLVRVTIPLLLPTMLTGFALALARALGEYGSVIFISGNLPLRTEIAPLLIVTRLEEYDYHGAAAIATVLLCTSLVLLLAINLLQRRVAAQRAL